MSSIEENRIRSTGINLEIFQKDAVIVISSKLKILLVFCKGKFLISETLSFRTAPSWKLLEAARPAKPDIAV